MSGRLAVSLVLLGAVALRVWDLWRTSIWFDEAYSLFLAQQHLPELLRRLRTEDMHPPLYYAVLGLWIKLFGTSELALRLPSALMGVVLVGLTYLLARRLVDERCALTAAALVAISPFQLMASRDARMYPFLAVFALGATYALWLALDSGQRRYWVGYAGAVAAAVYTHHFAFLVLLAHAVYVAAYARHALRPWLAAGAAVAVAYLPFVPVLWVQLHHQRAWPIVRPPFGLSALADLVGLLSFGGELLGMGSYHQRSLLPLLGKLAVVLPFLLLLVLGIFSVPPRARAFLVSYLALPVAVAGLVSIKMNVFYDRYFSFVIPPYAILLAGGIWGIGRGAPELRRTALAAGAGLVVVVYSLPALGTIYYGPSPYDWRGAAAYVAERARPDDLIMYIPAFAYLPFDYYFSGPQVRAQLNPRELLPKGTTPRAEWLAKQQELHALAAQHPRMWIVATIPLGVEARLRFQELVRPYFVEREGRDFRWVYVFLWESKVYRPRAGRP
ncbi:MAG: glycosyltransferase family 39 protein [Armatimonadota bacterium]|nr:glycosyltransferase family 39 protein [Armatimonadota bacterium]